MSDDIKGPEWYESTWPVSHMSDEERAISLLKQTPPEEVIQHIVNVQVELDRSQDELDHYKKIKAKELEGRRRGGRVGKLRKSPEELLALVDRYQAKYPLAGIRQACKAVAEDENRGVTDPKRRISGSTIEKDILPLRKARELSKK